jgi:hypothetical protein
VVSARAILLFGKEERGKKKEEREELTAVLDDFGLIWLP